MRGMNFCAKPGKGSPTHQRRAAPSPAIFVNKRKIRRPARAGWEKHRRATACRLGGGDRRGPRFPVADSWCARAPAGMRKMESDPAKAGTPGRRSDPSSPSAGRRHPDPRPYCLFSGSADQSLYSSGHRLRWKGPEISSHWLRRQKADAEARRPCRFRAPRERGSASRLRKARASSREGGFRECLCVPLRLAHDGLRTVSPSANFPAPIADFRVIFRHGRACPGLSRPLLGSARV